MSANTNTTVISIAPLQSDRWRIRKVSQHVFHSRNWHKNDLTERLKLSVEQFDVCSLVGIWFQALGAATEKAL